MDVFREDGHLTEEALRALSLGEDLEELERLELAEHLAFCDLCLERYTALLAGAELLVPERSCQETLWKRIRSRAIRLVVNRYAAAAAAVGLALTVVWGSGSAALPVPRLPEIPREQRYAVSEGFRQWSLSLDDAMRELNTILSGSTRQGGNHS